jgi:hypothetical protein
LGPEINKNTAVCHWPVERRIRWNCKKLQSFAQEEKKFSVIYCIALRIVTKLLRSYDFELTSAGVAL